MRAVGPGAEEWNLDERTTKALVDVLVGLFPDDDGGITTLQDMLVDIELDRNETTRRGRPPMSRF